MNKNKEKLITKLVIEKAKQNNTIDLDAYTNGLSDMWEAMCVLLKDHKIHK